MTRTGPAAPILVHAEQGMGDTLLMIRYAPRVKARGGEVIVACPKPLLKILGFNLANVVYNDMEAYAAGNASCRNAVLTFLSTWTSELHRHGYAAGVYENLNLGARDLASVVEGFSHPSRVGAHRSSPAVRAGAPRAPAAGSAELRPEAAGPRR